MICQVYLVSATPNPQQTVWVAMHQDYYSGIACLDKRPSETEAGKIVVKQLLNGNRGHYGPLEQNGITFNLANVPHSVMQQIRTHRVGISFDVQSFRYTSDQILQVAEGASVEKAIYFRPVGEYTYRQGKKYYYSEEARRVDIMEAHKLCLLYARKYSEGMPEEMARSMLPFDYLQNMVVSFNARSLMHMLDLRWKADAQLECQTLCDNLFVEFEKWMPEIANWYLDNRAKKARLAP